MKSAEFTSYWALKPGAHSVTRDWKQVSVREWRHVSTGILLYCEADGLWYAYNAELEKLTDGFASRFAASAAVEEWLR